LELCRVDEAGAPRKRDDVQNHDDAKWGNDEDEKRGRVAEPAFASTISWPEVCVEAGELDDEGWYHDKNWHDPAERGVHTEALPLQA
jgi:hypothetical protein